MGGNAGGGGGGVQAAGEDLGGASMIPRIGEKPILTTDTNTGYKARSKLKEVGRGLGVGDEEELSVALRKLVAKRPLRYKLSVRNERNAF